MAKNMNELFDNIYKIPKVPEVVRNLIIQLNDPDFDIDEIVKNVSRDQVISMKVLRLVNSAHFGLSRKIVSIEDAVILIGMKQLKTLVIASGIVSAVPELDNFDLKTFWSDSFRTATYAKWIADEINTDSEMAFTAGLISNMGQILIHMGAPETVCEIEKFVKSGGRRTEIEQTLLGYTNAEVCAELCRRWKFPDVLIETIKQCHEPLKFENPSTDACIINIAEYLSACRRDNLSLEDMMETFPADVLMRLGIEREEFSDKLPVLLKSNSGLDSLAA